MTTNKLIVYITIIFIILIIGIKSFNKVISKNHENLYIVTEKLILESAERCYLKKECNKKVTLKDLYEKKYLHKLVMDPVKKSLYNEKSYVVIDVIKGSKFIEV